MGSQKKQIKVRLARPEDIPRIAEIAQITWDEAYATMIHSANRRQVIERSYDWLGLSETLESPYDWFFVGILHGNIAGFAHFLLRADGYAELARLYVLPEAQGKGVGQQLLDGGLNTLKSQGKTQCFVTVLEQNLTARKFYLRFGFTLVRRFADFIGDQLLPLVEYVYLIEGD